MCGFCCLENSLQHKWSLKPNTWGLGGKKEQRTERYKSDWTEHRSRARRGQDNPEWASPALTSEARSFLCEAHTEQRAGAEQRALVTCVRGLQRSAGEGRAGKMLCRREGNDFLLTSKQQFLLHLVSGNFLPILCSQETSSTIPLLGQSSIFCDANENKI